MSEQGGEAGGGPASEGTGRGRPALEFFRALWHTKPALALVWWVLLLAMAVLPPLFAVLIALVIEAVSEGRDTAVGITVALCFIVMQVLPQIQTAVSMGLGSRLAIRLNERLAAAGATPAGLAHLEKAELAVPADFNRGGEGPPLYLAVDFVRGALLQLLVGVVSALALAWYSWWAALVLAAVWGATHWLLKDSAVWEDRDAAAVNLRRQHAEYAYELATGPAAAKEIRLFGLQDWVVDRFARRRRELYDAQFLATRLRHRAVAAAAVLVVVGNTAVFLGMAQQWSSGAWSVAHLAASAQLAIGVQWLAFGGLSWAVDDAAAAVAVVDRLSPALAAEGRLDSGTRRPPVGAVEVELRDVVFGYPTAERPVLRGLNLRIRPGESLALVGANGEGKTSLAKLLCRFYDPERGAVLLNGVDLREIDTDAWRRRVAAVFQDFTRFERSLRDNVDPAGRAGDDEVLAALRDAGAGDLAPLDAPMSRAHPGGRELSGGQWQRVALARVLCGARGGAGLIILDEPTANLDVRGEATIFARLLEETRGMTTLLISHRFSTVRQADRIAVLSGGVIAELGTHDELMAADGLYQRMFTLQAARFAEGRKDDGDRVHLPG